MPYSPSGPGPARPRRRSLRLKARFLRPRVSARAGARHRRGVTEGWVEETYDKCADDLTRFATGLVGPSDAADVVSAVMVRVLGRSSARAVHDGRAYLFRAVVNEARMHHRSTMRRRAREARDARSTAPTAVDDVAGLRPDVLEAVGQLSVRQRAVVVLHYWDDLDDEAIARLLGIGTGTVRRHLARAHERLRRSIDRD
jgi:RNA polymerase sigma factor (sigma-70 family)